MRNYIVALFFVLTGCSGTGLNIMPGDKDSGCTRMISQGEAGSSSVIAEADAGYCKYIEKGDCPTLSGMTFKEFKEMCREL